MGATVTEMVAVLMTDLVGSTAIAGRVGPDAAEDLRHEYFGLLRAALGHTAGREVKSLGDGLMAVFSGAAQSLACAVAMQQAVEARNSRAQERLGVRIGVSVERFGVRIGVSVGDATVEDGDYFGEPVVESARLCASAEGGQIIVNDLLRRLAGSRDGHSFKSLGRLELKGIAEPVHAFELQWEPAPMVGIALPKRLREPPGTAYVGRVPERERLAELWGQAREGSPRVALIGGEAGVGKTRLATHLALQAHGEGATVLYGRCDEDLGVPYQPWAQALGYLVREAPQPILDGHVERHGGDLARLVPALRDRVVELPSPRQSDPETERYLLYAAAAGLLEGAGEQEPLLLILDDLHWADGPTLSLLRHIVTTGTSMRLLVVGAYRYCDLSREHPLVALLADLHREQGVQRIELTGLQAADVVALTEAAAGHELGEDGQALAREIARETAGNPFFAGELLRHLAESGATVQQDDGRWRLVGYLADLGLPQSVREVVGRRVERLGPDARTALSAAAVIGREFDLDLLSGAVELPEARLLDLLEQAVAASLLHEAGESAGRFAFTHGLVEHTLYEDLGRTRRARLHKRVAQALEEQCGEDPGERLGELAAHWVAAAGSADTAKAQHYARRAAERALAVLAPDEAVRWYRQALDLHGQALDLHAQGAGGQRSERCELLIGLGEAQRQIGDAASRRTLLGAAALAQQLGDTDRLARAVLANTRGMTSYTGAVDSERVYALQVTAQALPAGDPRRAWVLALLASELHYGGEPARCRQLAAEAIEIARAAGDPAALAHTLAHATYAIGTPDTLCERRRLSDELVDLTRHLDDPWLSFIAASRQFIASVEAGDGALAESSLLRMRALAATVPQPTIRWIRSLYEGVHSLLQGDLQEAERWATTAAEAGTASGEPDALIVFGAQLGVVRFFQGRLGELAGQIAQLSGERDSLAAWRAINAVALIESGREDQARELALAENFQSIPLVQTWSGAVFAWSSVCCRLGLVERVSELYEMLAPFSGQLAGGGAVVSGPIDWALATLASTLERYDQAEEHFARSAEIEQRLGAPLYLVRTRASCRT